MGRARYREGIEGGEGKEREGKEKGGRMDRDGVCVIVFRGLDSPVIIIIIIWVAR